MDIISSTTPKSPEPEPELTPTRIQQPNAIATPKPLSFSNGVLKRHHPPQHYHHHHQLPNPPAAAAVVTYKECLKNHAASLGGHALDGCGEFMPAPTVTAGDPTSIKCAACGCHRNFHRRGDPDDPPPLSPVVEFQPHHRHHPPPPPPPPPFHPANNHHHPPRSPSSASPPPISSSYYPSAPHMLLALSSGGALPIPPENTAAPASAHHHLGSRKRFRTKFTQDQKEKMHRFAERVGWKMQKRDEDLVQEFCRDVGVDRGVLKVWMHNNKNTFAKRDLSSAPRNLLEQPPNGLNGDVNGADGSSGNDDDVAGDSGANGGGTNASSSSS